MAELFSELPLEILCEIIKFLRLKDLRTLSLASRLTRSQAIHFIFGHLRYTCDLPPKVRKIHQARKDVKEVIKCCLFKCLWFYFFDILFGKENLNYSPNIYLLENLKIVLTYSNSWKPSQIYRFFTLQHSFHDISLTLLPLSDILLFSSSTFILALHLLKDPLRRVLLAWKNSAYSGMRVTTRMSRGAL